MKGASGGVGDFKEICCSHRRKVHGGALNHTRLISCRDIHPAHSLSGSCLATRSNHLSWSIMRASWVIALCSLAHGLSIEPNWKHTNALRTIDLTKSYVKESLAVIIENVSKEPQSTYYLPREPETIYSFLEAHEKGKESGRTSGLSVTQGDDSWQIDLASPVPAGDKITLAISSAKLRQLVPSPKKIDQNGKQYLSLTASKYIPSFYTSDKEKTKIKLPTSDVASFTQGGDRQDNVLVYGPYESISPGTKNTVAVRYEHTAPIATVTYFERDIEVSHWGGNIAFEERYAITNDGAHLKAQFDRIAFAQSGFYNPQSSAIKNLVFPLPVGTRDAYFTDEIGNVSTSKFRSSIREAVLDLKPRYPIFGGWNYTFTVGWNNNLGQFLKTKGPKHYLRVPFLEGADNINYVDLRVRVILPEGATNIKVHSPVAIVSEQHGLHKTFMDTIGRSVVQLEARNLVDEKARQELFVEYDYEGMVAYRKPLVVVAGLALLFATSAVFSKVI